MGPACQSCPPRRGPRRRRSREAFVALLLLLLLHAVLFKFLLCYSRRVRIGSAQEPVRTADLVSSSQLQEPDASPALRGHNGGRTVDGLTMSLFGWDVIALLPRIIDAHYILGQMGAPGATRLDIHQLAQIHDRMVVSASLAKESRRRCPTASFRG